MRKVRASVTIYDEWIDQEMFDDEELWKKTEQELKDYAKELLIEYLASWWHDDDINWWADKIEVTIANV